MFAQPDSPIPDSGNPLTALTGAAVGALLALLLRTLTGGDPAQLLLPVDSRPLSTILHLVTGAVLGAVVGTTVSYRPRGYAALAAGGALTAVLWWMIGPLTLAPLIDGRAPTWSAEEAGVRFSNLIVALVLGTAIGLALTLILAGAGDRLARRAGRRDQADRDIDVVILGGGFAGVAAAQRLEKLRPERRRLRVTLVSKSNSLLFTPMLAEVAGSSLEPQHISSPVRASVPRTRFIRAAATAIDTDAKVIQLDGSSTNKLHYDHLVLALGSVPAFRDLPGIEEHGLTLKSLDDATRVRNHAIGMLELADACPDPVERRRLLTFVVAGAGFAGTETVAELFDLAHSTLRYYPNVPAEELRFVLVHSRDRILPEIGPELADYALRRLQRRGIEFALGVRIAGATATAVELADGTSIATRTLIWTAGNQPNPLLASLPCHHTRGAVTTTPTMAVADLDGVWAIGDGASIPDPASDGGTYPPTAQHALRQGKVVADNVAAVASGGKPKPFRFKAIGILVALGHRTAVAEIRGFRFSGLAAWMMWRAIYLSKLPGLEQKVRVLLDWTLDFFFPRDITLTGEPPRIESPESHPERPVGLGVTAGRVGP